MEKAIRGIIHSLIWAMIKASFSASLVAEHEMEEKLLSILIIPLVKIRRANLIHEINYWDK